MHPECPARLEAIREGLRAAGLDKVLTPVKARPASDEELLYCHRPEYVALAKREILGGVECLSTGDANVCERSLDAALMAAGGVMQAVDAVMAGHIRNAFCAVRPPGHHATSSQGMGFCIFNNVAIAARHAQRKHKIGKVLIVDWDIHHGNGTQEIFNEDGTVLYFSTHLFPWYPGTGWKEDIGKGKGRGCIINCPFPAGAGKNLVLGAFREKLVPAARTFKPEFVFISAGFDSRQGDPLGRFILTDPDFAQMTRIVMDLARESAHDRLVSVLEGGYNLDGLGLAVAAHVKALVTA